MDAGCVVKDELASFDIFDAEDSIPCGLRPFGDDGNLLSDDPVEEGRFPNIGPAEDGNKTGFKRSHTYPIADCGLRLRRRPRGASAPEGEPSGSERLQIAELKLSFTLRV